MGLEMFPLLMKFAPIVRESPFTFKPSHSVKRPVGHPLRFYICAMIQAQKGQNSREDDSRLYFIGTLVISDSRSMGQGKDRIRKCALQHPTYNVHGDQMTVVDNVT
jgi:hypothetical protein